MIIITVYIFYVFEYHLSHIIVLKFIRGSISEMQEERTTHSDEK